MHKEIVNNEIAIVNRDLLSANSTFKEGRTLSPTLPISPIILDKTEWIWGGGGQDKEQELLDTSISCERQFSHSN